MGSLGCKWIIMQSKHSKALRCWAVFWVVTEWWHYDAHWWSWRRVLRIWGSLMVMEACPDAMRLTDGHGGVSWGDEAHWWSWRRVLRIWSSLIGCLCRCGVVWWPRLSTISTPLTSSGCLERGATCTRPSCSPTLRTACVNGCSSALAGVSNTSLTANRYIYI